MNQKREQCLLIYLHYPIHIKIMFFVSVFCDNLRCHKSSWLFATGCVQNWTNCLRGNFQVKTMIYLKVFNFSGMFSNISNKMKPCPGPYVHLGVGLAFQLLSPLDTEAFILQCCITAIHIHYPPAHRFLQEFWNYGLASNNSLQS